MRQSTMILLLAVMVACSPPGKEKTNTQSTSKPTVEDNFQFATQQTSLMLEVLGDSQLHPRTAEENGSLRLVKSKDWTSGFFPGNLWFLYEYTEDEKWKNAAQKFTSNIEDQQWNGGTHDMGFKMYCSYGSGYRLTENPKYREVLIQSAKTLITRFNPTVGAIRSWDFNADTWQFPVIIDNMMNLELLFWATSETGDSIYYDMAVAHAETTLNNHFREDNSSYHVLNYDTLTGEVLDRHTHQGFAHESSWARGQAWGLYGFTMAYRETDDPKFLEKANDIAAFLLDHPTMPQDLVPYWDFDAPDIPNEPRDVSAAAVICSALYELSDYSSEKKSEYLAAANMILENLSSPSYRSAIGENNHFLLMHSTGNWPKNDEIDVPIIYADYYWLEANLRKLKYAE